MTFPVRFQRSHSRKRYFLAKTQMFQDKIRLLQDDLEVERELRARVRT